MEHQERGEVSSVLGQLCLQPTSHIAIVTVFPLVNFFSCRDGCSVRGRQLQPRPSGLPTSHSHFLVVMPLCNPICRLDLVTCSNKQNTAKVMGCHVQDLVTKDCDFHLARMFFLPLPMHCSKASCHAVSYLMERPS